MHYLRWMAGVVIVVAGCAQEMPVRDASERSVADGKGAVAGVASPSQATAPVAIPFNDIQSFDKELAKSLKGNPEKVTVIVEDRIPLKEMPPRVDKWLAAVDSGGGKVNIKSDVPEPRTRALPLIGMAISAFQLYREHAKDSQYDAAKTYDATVFYKRDANGDRIVDRIEMLRRGAGGGE